MNTPIDKASLEIDCTNKTFWIDTDDPDWDPNFEAEGPQITLMKSTMIVVILAVRMLNLVDKSLEELTAIHLKELEAIKASQLDPGNDARPK